MVRVDLEEPPVARRRLLRPLLLEEAQGAQLVSLGEPRCERERPLAVIERLARALSREPYVREVAECEREVRLQPQRSLAGGSCFFVAVELTQRTTQIAVRFCEIGLQ